MSIDNNKSASVKKSAIAGLFSDDIETGIESSTSPDGKRTKKVVAKIGAITILPPKNSLLLAVPSHVDDDFFTRIALANEFGGMNYNEDEDAMAEAYKSKLLEAAQQGGLRKTVASSMNSNTSQNGMMGSVNSVYKVSDIVSEKSMHIAGFGNRINSNGYLSEQEHLNQEYDILSAPVEIGDIDLISSAMEDHENKMELNQPQNEFENDDNDGFFIPPALDDEEMQNHGGMFNDNNENEKEQQIQENDVLKSQKLSQDGSVDPNAERNEEEKKKSMKKRKRSSVDLGKAVEDESTQLDVEQLKGWLSNSEGLVEPKENLLNLKNHEKHFNSNSSDDDDEEAIEAKLFKHFPSELQEFFGFKKAFEKDLPMSDFVKLAFDFVDNDESKANKRRKTIRKNDVNRQPEPDNDDNNFFIPDGEDNEEIEMMRREQQQNPSFHEEEPANLWFDPPVEFGDGKDDVENLINHPEMKKFHPKERDQEIDENDEIHQILKASSGVSGASKGESARADDRGNLKLDWRNW